MQFFKKKAKSSSRVGLVVSSDQLAVAHMGERNADYMIRRQANKAALRCHAAWFEASAS